MFVKEYQTFTFNQIKILEYIFNIDNCPDQQVYRLISNMFKKTNQSIQIWFFTRQFKKKRNENITYNNVTLECNEWDNFDFLDFKKNK